MTASPANQLWWTWGELNSRLDIRLHGYYKFVLPYFEQRSKRQAKLSIACFDYCDLNPAKQLDSRSSRC